MQKKLKVRIKRLHKDSVLPCYSKNGDAGMDLTATSRIFDKDGNVSYGIGLAFEIPEGYVGLLFPRSSNCKQDLILSNSVGVIDSGYRGEVMFKFKPSPIFAGNYIEESIDTETFDYVGLHDENRYYNVGDRIGQIIILPYPKIEFEEVEELSKTERGIGGYGSSGK